MDKAGSRLMGALFPQTRTFLKLMGWLLLYTVAVAWCDDHYFPKTKFMEAYGMTATTGGVVGLLLAFRTNTAYERWWEGRKL